MANQCSMATSLYRSARSFATSAKRSSNEIPAAVDRTPRFSWQVDDIGRTIANNWRAINHLTRSTRWWRRRSAHDDRQSDRPRAGCPTIRAVVTADARQRLRHAYCSRERFVAAVLFDRRP